MTSPARLPGPYKGLTPYEERDAAIFFGRDAEREVIAANLVASRLTLLYGPSGVGKSSVLRAGVVSILREQSRHQHAEHGRPNVAIAVFSAWRDDPLPALLETVRAAVAEALPGAHSVAPVPSTPPPLADVLDRWVEQLGGEILIVLDQFEEYFLYHPREDGAGTFAVEFPRAVNRRDLRVNFLIAIREDSLAKLDRFKGRIPDLFGNYLRLDYLDPDAARAAVEKPLAHYNSLLPQDQSPVRIEPALVDAVLGQVQVGQVVLGPAGSGTVAAGRAADPSEMRIDTPYLQVVMTRLWQEEMDRGSRVLRLDTLTRLGGAERIVRTHLDGAMQRLSPADQDTASRVFHHLVTPSGTKIAHAVPDLAEYAGASDRDVESVMEQLAATRIVRSVPPAPGQLTAARYEIFHDVLAPAILDWQARYHRQRAYLLPAAAVGVGWGVLGVLALLGLRMLGRRGGLPEDVAASSEYLLAQFMLGWPFATVASVVVAVRSRAARRQSAGFLAALSSAAVFTAGVYLVTRWGPGGRGLVHDPEFWGEFGEDLAGLALLAILSSFSAVAGVIAFQRWLQHARRLAGSRERLRRSLGVAGRLVLLQWLAILLAAGLASLAGEVVLGPGSESGAPWKHTVDVALILAGAAVAATLNTAIWTSIRSEPARWQLALMAAAWILPVAVGLLVMLWTVGRGRLFGEDDGMELAGVVLFVQSVAGGLVTTWLCWRASRSGTGGEDEVAERTHTARAAM
ncbi:MAG TPA: ATP-binding protein [Methylomirabilota bacterium]|nr:ATP-binding protein [Methylomirabilota bacterium]